MAKPRFLGIFSQEETEKMLAIAKSVGMEDTFYMDGQALYCTSWGKDLSEFWIEYNKQSMEDG
jgi:hypothetical protein